MQILRETTSHRRYKQPGEGHFKSLILANQKLDLLRFSVSQRGFDEFLWDRVWYWFIRGFERLSPEGNNLAILLYEICTFAAQFYVQPAHVLLPDRQTVFQVVNHKPIKFFTRQNDSLPAPKLVST